MKTLLAALLACLITPQLGAAMLRGWTTLRPGVDVGAFADAGGTTVTFAAVPGPAAGGRALRLDAKLVQWGGVWTTVRGTIPAGGALAFSARSRRPLTLRVDLNDSGLRSVVHSVRLHGGSWERFTLPVAAFTAASWSNPRAKAGAFELADLSSVAFSPTDPGHDEVVIGPLEAVGAAPSVRDGGMDAGTVQDFVALPASGYGPFADSQGSSIELTVRTDAPGFRGPAARVSYDEQPSGWCGEWIRAGAAWGGQDWSRAHGLEAEVYSADALSLRFDFNDANQNAYVSPSLTVKPGAWTLVRANFADFALNPYYQPPRALKGAPLDLTHVATFNLQPDTPGKHTFWVARVGLE